MARDGGLIGLSVVYRPDCLRFDGVGEGGTCDRVSTVLSDKDGRGLRGDMLSAPSLSGKISPIPAEIPLGGGDINPALGSSSSNLLAMLAI